MCSKVIIIGLLLFFQVAFSQGLFLDRGTSGAGASAGYSVGQNTISMVASFGYSFSGMFDLQYSFGRTIIERIYSEDITGNIQALNFAIQFYKQDTIKHPVTIGINFGYSWVNFKNNTYFYNTGSNDNLTMNVNLSKKSMLSNHFGVLGTVFYAYTLQRDAGVSSVGMQVAIISQGSKKLTIVFGPNIAMINDSFSIGVSAGVIYIPRGE